MGLDVTAALAHSNQDRLAKIIELIEGCKFSIHDLSRIEASRGIPRFNMPLELGIALYRSVQAEHHVFVFEGKAFRAQRSTSDINKMDPQIHNGTPKGVMSSLRSLFWQQDNPMTVPEMLRSFRAVKAKLPLLLKNAGSKTPFEKSVFELLKVAALVERQSIKQRGRGKRPVYD